MRRAGGRRAGTAAGVAASAAAVALAAIMLGSSPSASPADHLRSAMIRGGNDQVRRGAALFDRNCAVCHGDSGLGLQEARAAFPQDHRHCTRCHKPNNPVVMSLEQVHEEGRDHDLFPIGDPPPLRGEGALASLRTPTALFHYTRATMPRYRPGTMRDEEYLDVTAFLAYVNEWPGRDELLRPADVGMGGTGGE